MSDEIDVGDVVYWARKKSVFGPLIVDNIDGLTGKRWVNDVNCESCYLVDESLLFKDKLKAAVKAGKKLCGKYYASKKKLKELEEW